MSISLYRCTYIYIYIYIYIQGPAIYHIYHTQGPAKMQVKKTWRLLYYNTKKIATTSTQCWTEFPKSLTFLHFLCICFPGILIHKVHQKHDVIMSNSISLAVILQDNFREKCEMNLKIWRKVPCFYSWLCSVLGTLKAPFWSCSVRQFSDSFNLWNLFT